MTLSYMKNPIRLVAILVCLLYGKCLLAQFPSTYIFQKDDTVLRTQYLQQSVKKHKAAIASITQYSSDYKEFYNQQFSQAEDFWESTRPVTAPAVQAYLQQIAQKIITANDELKGTDARIVFSRDWWPNAVSMGDGTIAVNAGLFVFLENEAQLVYIISHELAHYHLAHTQSAIKGYVEKINSKEYKDEIKRLSKIEYGANKKIEDFIKSLAFDSRKHSRDKEAEADRKAFDFMKNTGYDRLAVKSCLQLLDKIDDSLYFSDSFSLNTFFNFPEYAFKPRWIQKESALFSEMKDEESFRDKKEKDSLKTHPDCSKRIALLQNDFDKETANGKLFLVNENLFRQLKQDFYFEMMEESYRSNSLSRNLYFNILLLSNHPDNKVAVYSITRCLNDLFALQKAHKIGLAIDAEDKGYPQSYNLLIRMLSRLKLDEILQVNTYFSKKYYSLVQDDEAFKKELIRLHDFKTN